MNLNIYLKIITKEMYETHLDANVQLEKKHLDKAHTDVKLSQKMMDALPRKSTYSK